MPKALQAPANTAVRFYDVHGSPVASEAIYQAFCDHHNSINHFQTPVTASDPGIQLLVYNFAMQFAGMTIFDCISRTLPNGPMADPNKAAILIRLQMAGLHTF